jgi:hypothetical protein
VTPSPPPQPLVQLTPGVHLAIQHVAPDRIVTVDGQPGLFTALVGLDPKDAASTKNLEQAVELLRAQVAQLQGANAELAAKLAQAESPATSSDDFAAGLQHSLDTLQGRLTDMDNATSDFAVREFSLESKVHVEVTSLGTIGFRFVQPGEPVDAAALSTVRVSVVPVPKPTGAVAPNTADVGVDAIDGLSGDQVSRLRAAHVTTAGSFLQVATRASTTASLASMLGIDRETLGRYTLLAGLLTVPGLDRVKAAVLYDAGITDAATLAAADARDVVRRYAAAAKRRRDDDGFRPGPDQAAEWIAAATSIVGAPAGP